jgi:uncharacterized protein (DUF4415 family)
VILFRLRRGALATCWTSAPVGGVRRIRGLSNPMFFTIFWRASFFLKPTREPPAAAAPRKTDVHLRVDPEAFEFFRAAGKGHLTRMAKVLKAYGQSHGAPPSDRRR